MPKTPYEQALAELTFLQAYLRRTYPHHSPNSPVTPPWAYKYIGNENLDVCEENGWINGYSKQLIYFNRQSKKYARELLEKYQIEDTDFDEKYDFFENDDEPV